MNIHCGPDPCSEALSELGVFPTCVTDLQQALHIGHVLLDSKLEWHKTTVNILFTPYSSHGPEIG